MTRACVLAIDVGASGTKAAAYDLAGAILGRGQVAHALRVPSSGTVEQDPEVWWTAAAQATQAALRDLPSGDRVEAIAVSSTNALVALDRTGHPVRPAIMQLDGRGRVEADRLRRSHGATIARVTGRRVTGTGYWLPVLAWLHEHEPDALTAIGAVLYPGGFLVQRMTGIPTIDTTRAATTLLFDHRSRTWSDVLVREAGLRSSQLPDVLDPCAVVGPLMAPAAGQLGVAAGTPVVAGAMDSVAAALGLGMLRVGDASIMLGTVARIGLLSAAWRSAGTNPSCPYPQGGLWCSMGALWDAGRWLQWAVDTFQDGEWTKLRSPGPPSDRDPLIAIPPGPGRDGAFLGVRIGHGRAELAEAAFLGVLAELAGVLGEVAEAEVQPPVRVGVCGPAAPLAAPALAGLIGTTVRVPADPEVETRGGALLAACGAGAYPDLTHAAAAMVPQPAIQVPTGNWHGYAMSAAAARRRQRAATRSGFDKPSPSAPGLCGGPASRRARRTPTLASKEMP